MSTNFCSGVTIIRIEAPSRQLNAQWEMVGIVREDWRHSKQRETKPNEESLVESSLPDTQE